MIVNLKYENMIRVENLDFSYKKRKVFAGVEMRFESGGIYGLLGRNGVGKTTFMKLVSGLLKDEGKRLTVDDSIPFERRPSFLKKVYFLPDSFSALPLTIEEYARAYGAFYPNFDAELLYKALMMLDVPSNVLMSRQSFGQQKKAMIAFALSLNTDLLLMDEPGNGLDIPSRMQFKRLLSNAIRPGKTILISTHQVKDIENVADHIMILDKGNVVMDASVEQIERNYMFVESPQKIFGALASIPVANGFVNISRRKNGDGIDRSGERERGNRVDLEALFEAVLENNAAFENCRTVV